MTASNHDQQAPPSPGGDDVLPRPLPSSPAQTSLPSQPSLFSQSSPSQDQPQAKAISQAVHVREEEDEQEIDVAAVAIRNAPPWLVSAAFHMMVVIILGLLLLPQLADQQIELESIWSDKLGEQLELDSVLIGNDDILEQVALLTPEDLLPVDHPFAAPPDAQVVIEGVTPSSKLAANIGMALTGREPGMKQSLLDRFGGNKLTKEAVDAGLQWLAKMQHREGYWSLTGPYADGSRDENRAAATAMALLAFQGNGNKPKTGPFAENVGRGWKWLLARQDNDGSFFQEGGLHNQRFYTQGQCTIALCEIYGMTKDETFREPAERAIDYCLRSQGPEGGWRYSPGFGSDVSVTGWIVMAMQSARMAGLKIPYDNLKRVERFLDDVAVKGGTRYPYLKHDPPTLAMTAEALLCRQYLGWARDDPRLVDGTTWITQPENLVNYQEGRDVYYWYYATQVAHHMGGDYWKRWNAVMRQKVPEHQEKAGRDVGSWSPDHPTTDEWASEGGRLYVTCLSLYMLQVYYRHLPIYSGVY